MLPRLPLISSEHWSINTSLSEDVDVAENTRKRSVGHVAAASLSGQPHLTAVLNQHTKHSAL